MSNDKLTQAIREACEILAPLGIQPLLRGEPVGIEDAAARLEVGMPLSPELGLHVAQALRLRALPRKNKHGDNPAQVEIRNRAITAAALKARSVGLHLTRGRDKHGKQENPSACAVVGWVLKELGIELGERSVGDIVNRQIAERRRRGMLARALLRNP